MGDKDDQPITWHEQSVQTIIGVIDPNTVFPTDIADFMSTFFISSSPTYPKDALKMSEEVIYDNALVALELIPDSYVGAQASYEGTGIYS